MDFGVIFDLDGTLADTLQDITAGVNYAVDAAGDALFTQDQVRAWVGDGIHDLIVRASRREDEEWVAGCVARFRDHAREHCLDHTRLYPGWTEALAELRHGEVPMAVLSNKPDAVTGRICEALIEPGILRHVEGQRDGYPRKPDPTRALAIAGILGRDPAQMLIVGDSENDVRTAQAAGFQFVGVGWGFRTVAQLRAWGVTTIIDHPSEVAAWLRSRT